MYKMLLYLLQLLIAVYIFISQNREHKSKAEASSQNELPFISRRTYLKKKENGISC